MCCCCCTTHVFLLCCKQNILQKNERTTSENDWNTVQRKRLRWITIRTLFLWRCEWTIVAYSLSHRTSEAAFKLHEAVMYFRSDRMSLLFMGEIRVKTRFSYRCTVAKATYIQWSKILTVCNIARFQAGYVLWLQLFCCTIILSHSDLQLSAWQRLISIAVDQK